MSKQGKRKITVELPKSKDLANRPSVFDRLGTKKSSSVKKQLNIVDSGLNTAVVLMAKAASLPLPIH